MGLRAMLTVDLNGVDSETRTKFNDELSKRNWTKIPKLTTTWRASFGDDVSAEDAETIANHEVWEITKKLNIANWEACVMVGPRKPHNF